MSTEPATEGTTNNNNPLEQYVQLAKIAKGASAVELIKQVIAAPGVYVFGELLSMPRIKELETGPTANYYNTLFLFAYGTYRMYLENKSNFIDLGPIETRKLQHLTIVTLATELKCIPYSILLKDLDIKNVRDLEDLIIEAIYADIIHGKLDQKNSQLELDYAIGRDMQPSQMGNVIATLQEWCDSCEAILACVETQINRANSEKNRALKHKDEIEQEIMNIKKALKTQTHDTDESMATDVITIGSTDKAAKKSSKSKPMRTGTKFWQK